MKLINHGEYQKKVKWMTYSELLYAINDCKAAIKANPDSEKSQGYYQDEINYCVSELKRRRDSAEANYKKCPGLTSEIDINHANAFLRSVGSAYIVSSFNNKVLVPSAVDKEDAIDQAFEIFTNMSRGRVTKNDLEAEAAEDLIIL